VITMLLVGATVERKVPTEKYGHLCIKVDVAFETETIQELLNEVDTEIKDYIENNRM